MAAGTLASLWTKKLKPASVQPKASGNVDAVSKEHCKGDAAMGECGAKEPHVSARSPVHSPSAAKLPMPDGNDGGESEGQARKRKRTRMSGAQLEQLQAIFSRTTYPSSDETQSIARETGLEVAQVQQWFKNSRRKKACLGKDKGRGASAGSQAHTQEQVILLQDDADEDGDTASATPAEAHSPRQDASQAAHEPSATPVTTADPTAPAAEQIVDLEAENPAGEEDGDSALNKEAELASAPEPASQPRGKEAEAAKPSSSSKKQGEAVGQQGMIGATSAQWSVQWMSRQLARIESEASRLRSFVHETQPLQPLADEPLSAVNKAQVASLVAGSQLTIGQLLDRLHQNPVDQDFLRTCILDVATRRSFAAREGKGERDDALTNEDPALLWRWELRNLHSLPKPLQPQYKQLKKTLQEAGARLTALKAAQLALTDAVAKGKATTKAEKAVAKLAKTQAPAGVSTTAAPDATDVPDPMVQAATQGDESAKQVSTQPSSQQQQQESQGQGKKAEREAQKQEKEAARREKEAEKEKQKVEKEALKAQQRQEKEKAKEQQRLEKEQQKQEKEQQKQEKKTKGALAGFGSAETIAKSRMAFTSFFKKTPGPGFSRSALKAAATPNADSPLKGRALDASFSPQDATDGTAGVDEALQAKIERELQMQRSPQDVQNSFKTLLARWKALPKHKRVKGLPPSWARKMQARVQSADLGDEELSCCTWRRKFLWFPSELGEDGLAYPQPHWPPYYGSWSKKSTVIKPRNPLAKDPAIDYEVMEDEEWEPEPEGDSLSNDEADEEDNMVEDSVNDGFFVPDGQLSDDEGLSSAQQDIDAMCAETEDDVLGGDASTAEAASTAAAVVAKQRLLEAAMRKAAPHPLIISRLRPDTAAQGCLHGDAALLGAFAAQVVTPGLQVCVPPSVEAGTPAKTPGARPERAAGGLERPDELVPELLRFLQAHPEIKAVPKVVQAFCDAHADRKLVKKWVGDKVRELAERQPGGWRLRVQPASLLPEEPSSPTQAPEQSSQEQRMSSASNPRSSEADSLEVESTADPRWRSLVSSLVNSAGNDCGSNPFSVIAQTQQPSAVPGFALAAMLKSLGSDGAASRQREACARNLAQLVSLLATAQPAGLKSPPHKVWGDARTAPEPASLATFYAEAQLQPLLLRCLNSPSVEVSKSTALLLGALVRVGCPAKLVGKQTEQSSTPPSDTLEAAAAFRAALAGDSSWVKALMAGCQSPTLLTYKLLVVCYLLHDSASRGALLGEASSYQDVLSALLTGCREHHMGCTKYGAVGLSYLLRWHMTPEGKPLTAENEASLSRALSGLLRSKQGSTAQPDEATLAALEAAKCLGEATKSGGSMGSGSDDETPQQELITAVRSISSRATGTAEAAFQSALQALDGSLALD